MIWELDEKKDLIFYNGHFFTVQYRYWHDTDTSQDPIDFACRHDISKFWIFDEPMVAYGVLVSYQAVWKRPIDAKKNLSVDIRHNILDTIKNSRKMINFTFVGNASFNFGIVETISLPSLYWKPRILYSSK